ncbi:efflux RND transporter periplasmic adaptor subunit [Agrobacterium sp. ES01]|uniref:efflux RND transporter periplasmic adaptor subunit n=1 Tax=Agrobacterium sp. ES01 TaxID=3420714 RepID=UPI003D144DD5
MAFWKQLLLAIIVLVAGFFVWIWLVPGSGAVLARLGVPAGVVAMVSTSQTEGGDAAGAKRGGGRGFGNTPQVVVQPVAIGKVNDRLTAIGSGEAVQSVIVTPQVAGTLKEVLVKSGDLVEAGQVMARIKDEEQIIARDQAKVELNSALEKAKLYENLKSTISRIDAFNADIAVQTAKLAVETAALNLQRREITAPISGVAGIVTVDPGDNVTTTTAIVSLDDRSEILVDFWVPERFAPIIKVGQPVEATAVARPAGLYRGAVEAIDNRIDEASRTLHVRARIANENDDLRAGMAFTVAMTFDGEDYPAVDPLAIQWDSDGSYVWRVSDGKAEKVTVRIVQRNPDSILVEAALSAGDDIIIEGVQRVRAGGEVAIAGEQRPADTKPSAEAPQQEAAKQ